MRKTLAWLALVAPCACGGRTLGDWPEQAFGGGGSASGTASGGSVPPGGTDGVSSGSGGRSNGGSVSLSGAPSSGGHASGGFVSGGFASGGYASGGTPSGGSAGREPCFEATQPDKGLCIHVRLCSAAQYETLCLMDTPSSAVCFCYVNGEVKSAKSILSATSDTLCDPAVAAECP